MANLYVRFTDGTVESLKVGGAPASIVKLARDVVAQHAGDDSALRLFGMRGFNAKGNPTASVRERGMAAGLRGGEGFAVIAQGITVAAAENLSDALTCIEDAEILLGRAAMV